MSAAALMEWLGEHLPEAQRLARECATQTEFCGYMDWLAGLPQQCYDSHDHRCAVYLQALQNRAPAPIKTKPTPQLIPEVWQAERPNADRAWAAVLAVCIVLKGVFA